MRKIRIMEHVSLDGVIQPSGDDDFAQGGWMAAYRTPAGAVAVAEAQGTSFDLLLGRRTYDLWADFWPKIKGGPFSGVRRVKSTDGPDLIVWGSSTLTSVLLGEGLVDEVVLILYPILLGRGKRFFSDSADSRELAFVSTKTTSSGVLINTYRHIGLLRTESVADASG